VFSTTKMILLIRIIAGISTGENNGNTIFQSRKKGQAFRKHYYNIIIITRYIYSCILQAVGTNPVMAYENFIVATFKPIRARRGRLSPRSSKIPICGYATKKSLLRSLWIYDISEEAGPWFYGVGFSRNSILGYGSQLLIRGTWFLLCILSRKDSSHKFYIVLFYYL